MAFTTDDAKTHSKSIKSAGEAKLWASVANKALKAKPGDEAGAIKAANAAVTNANRKGPAPPFTKESVTPGVVDLQEYTASTDRMAVNAELGTIEGVKILGMTSKNGREYTSGALQKAARLYEGKVVNVDHVESGQRRSYGDRLGNLSNVSLREDGLYGTLIYNPNHRLAQQLAWDAANQPGNVGLSHDARGKTVHHNGKVIVEEILKVNSVDLVADPATTAGLFESTEDPAGDDAGTTQTHEEDRMSDLTLEALKKDRPDLVEAVLHEAAESEGAKALKAEHKALTEEVKKYKAAEEEAAEAAKLKEAIAAELKEAKIDTANTTLCSPAFMSALESAADADGRKALIDDRLAVFKTSAQRQPGTPVSESRHGDSGSGQTLATKELVESWRR